MAEQKKIAFLVGTEGIEVRVCDLNGWTLVTSRNPDDLPAFNSAALKAFGLD